MQIFITLPSPSIPTMGANQWLGAISNTRFAHVVGASIPIPCWGEWVFTVNVTDEEAAEYAVPNPLGSQDKSTQYFIVPVRRVAGIHPVSFESMTGRPWNAMTVTMLDTRAKRDRSNEVSWTLLWASRQSAATMTVAHKSDQLLQITATLAKDFDFATDYICFEQHTERPNPNVPSGVKESWLLGHVAGVAPTWATFPPAWKEWVGNAKVQASAVAYIRTHIPEANVAIDRALSFASKENVIGGWTEVKFIIDRELQKDLGGDVKIGTLATNSWTAVMAMPLRLALRLSNYTEHVWEPPVEKPEFSDPDASGRVLLANPTGTYPTHGLGVGEQMKDRYYMRREGEMLKNSSPRGTRPENRNFGSPFR